MSSLVSQVHDEHEVVRAVLDGAVLEVTLDRPKANVDRSRHQPADGRDLQGIPRRPGAAGGDRRDRGRALLHAGWDLKAAAEGDAVDGDYGVGGSGGRTAVRGDKPVIAAVSGMAGVGLVVAEEGSAIYIYAVEHSSFGGVRRSVRAPIVDAATCKLPRRIPYRRPRDGHAPHRAARHPGVPRPRTVWELFNERRRDRASGPAA